MHAPPLSVVLKFGGTSLADDAARRTAMGHVRNALARGHIPVVIASAMGRGHSPYATDALLALANGESGARNTDMLLSCGEIISAATFAALLSRSGIEAAALGGWQAGIVTDETFGDATILRVEPHAIMQLLDRGIVPVIAGFQGMTESGLITTLGRGGSDMTAVAIGHAIGAERVDIYTDVSGVMTADPRHVAKAQTLERISHDEMTELAERGANVMHHKAAQYARATRTAYSVKGLHNDVGTLVDDAGDRRRTIAGITSLGRRACVRLEQCDAHILERISAAGISVNLVTMDSALCFVVDIMSVPALRELLRKEKSSISIREGCAEISIVGAGLRRTPGIMSTLLNSLERAGIELIASVASSLAISAIVPSSDAETAKRVLHEAFRLDERVGLLKTAVS